jgi:hypothetical protein
MQAEQETSRKERDEAKAAAGKDVSQEKAAERLAKKAKRQADEAEKKAAEAEAKAKAAAAKSQQGATRSSPRSKSAAAAKRQRLQNA